jgi:hypothetical protein
MTLGRLAAMGAGGRLSRPANRATRASMASLRDSTRLIGDTLTDMEPAITIPSQG